jgi:hypothetical protein
VYDNMPLCPMGSLGRHLSRSKYAPTLYRKQRKNVVLSSPSSRPH